MSFEFSSKVIKAVNRRLYVISNCLRIMGHNECNIYSSGLFFFEGGGGGVFESLPFEFM
jgi:hypothetical protein